MVTKFFIGNVAWKATEEDIKDFFNDFGIVKSVKIITDQETGRSRGFGFVEIETDDPQSIFDLSGQEFMGRELNINKARERTQ